MQDYRRGFQAGIPIGLGYLSVSFTFGMMAVAAGLSWWQAALISMCTVTSAGQFAGLGMMPLPGQTLAILVSQLTINIRYSFMSVSLSQRLDSRFSGVWRWLLGFFVTDEIFAVASGEKCVTRSFFAGLATAPWFGWTLGTLIGALLGGILPHRLISALSLAIYSMFIAIVMPDVKAHRRVGLVVLLAIALRCLFYYVPGLTAVNSGLAISAAAVGAAVLGAALFPVAPEEKAGEQP